MRRALGFAAVAAVLSMSAQSYGLDPTLDPDRQRLEQQRLEQQRLENQRNNPNLINPSVVSKGPVIEGDVTRIDADSYVIRDLSGQDVRVYSIRAPCVRISKSAIMSSHGLIGLRRPMPRASPVVLPR